ncbi:transposase [Streptomyces pseudovenezuelae]|uniref:transposase n=1 Tax=Streptomyces pseudovenezuelae TaxID=67350 RepID=UPI0036E33834
MPRPYPPEFRARAIALVRAGKQAKQTAGELGIHPVTLSKWLRQDDIDTRAILVEVGRRKMVGGQEDMITDVALDLAAAGPLLPGAIGAAPAPALRRRRHRDQWSDSTSAVSPLAPSQVPGPGKHEGNERRATLL